MTLPLLKPALGVALIFRTLQAFLVFDVIYIMTGGGPGVSTETLSFLNWQTFLVEYRLRLRRRDLGDAGRHLAGHRRVSTCVCCDRRRVV